MTKKITLSVLSSLLFSTAVMADGTAVADEKIAVADVEAQYTAKSNVEATKELKQSINFGFANTTGNTKTLNVNGKYTLAFTTVGYNDQALKVAFDTSAFLTKNDGVKDNEEYTANLGLEQYIMDGWLGYGAINWLRNTFRNFDNKLNIGAGIGKEIFNDGQQTLKIKVGAAYNIEQYANAQADHKFASLNEYVEYHNKLNEVSSLYVKVGASQNFDDFSDSDVLGVIGFNFAVAEDISVSLEEEVRYDNLPPVGFSKTDTKSIIRVGYNF